MIRGGGKQSKAERSDHRCRGAIRGGGERSGGWERSEEEGSYKRWRKAIRGGGSDQRRWERRVVEVRSDGAAAGRGE